MTRLSAHVQEWWRRRSLCHTPPFEDRVYIDWFLRSLLPPIGKDVASHFPQTEEAALQIALKYDLIYAQSGYVYTVLPDLPKPGGTNATGASHSTDGIIGALSHTSSQPTMGYGFPRGGANTSSTFPPPGSRYLGHGMPSPFAPTPAYLNVAHPNTYPYPQPSVPAPLAFGPLTPLPSQLP